MDACGSTEVREAKQAREQKALENEQKGIPPFVIRRPDDVRRHSQQGHRHQDHQHKHESPGQRGKGVSSQQLAPANDQSKAPSHHYQRYAQSHKGDEVRSQHPASAKQAPLRALRSKQMPKRAQPWPGGPMRPLPLLPEDTRAAGPPQRSEKTRVQPGPPRGPSPTLRGSTQSNQKGPQRLEKTFVLPGTQGGLPQSMQKGPPRSEKILMPGPLRGLQPTLRGSTQSKHKGPLRSEKTLVQPFVLPGPPRGPPPTLRGPRGPRQPVSHSRRGGHTTAPDPPPPPPPEKPDFKRRAVRVNTFLGRTDTSGSAQSVSLSQVPTVAVSYGRPGRSDPVRMPTGHVTSGGKSDCESSTAVVRDASEGTYGGHSEQTLITPLGDQTLAIPLDLWNAIEQSGMQGNVRFR